MPSPPANVKKWYLNGKKAPVRLTDSLEKLERDIVFGSWMGSACGEEYFVI